MLRLNVRIVDQIKCRHDLYIYFGSRAVDGKRFLESNASLNPDTYVGISIPGTYAGFSIPGTYIGI